MSPKSLKQSLATTNCPPSLPSTSDPARASTQNPVLRSTYLSEIESELVAKLRQLLQDEDSNVALGAAGTLTKLLLGQEKERTRLEVEKLRNEATKIRAEARMKSAEMRAAKQSLKPTKHTPERPTEQPTTLATKPTPQLTTKQEHAVKSRDIQQAKAVLLGRVTPTIPGLMSHFLPTTTAATCKA